MGFNQDIQHKGYYVHELDGAILFQKKKGAIHGSEASLSQEEKREFHRIAQVRSRIYIGKKRESVRSLKVN